MSKENVVSIEDRIPKLKQARKKKANRRLIFYLSIFFFLISIVVYLQSPLSHIKKIVITGNSLLTDETVMDLGNLSKGINIWSIDKNEIIRSLEQDSAVVSANVKRKLPWTVEVNLVENDLAGYIQRDNHFYPLLGNGKILENKQQQRMTGDAPLIMDFTDKTYLDRMADELTKLPKSILSIISEIHWSPSKGNKNKIILYMNDGFTVAGSIRDFAERMQIYPSIADQLDPTVKGIIHIGVGVYFEQFGEDENRTEDEVDN